LHIFPSTCTDVSSSSSSSNASVGVTLSSGVEIDGRVLLSVIAQIQQENLLEMTAVDRILDAKIGALDESETITLLASFTYTPYITSDLKSILSLA